MVEDGGAAEDLTGAAAEEPGRPGPGAPDTGAPGGAAAPEPSDGLALARRALARAREEAAARGMRPSNAASRGRAPRRERRGGAGGMSGPGPDDRDPQPLGRSVGRLLDERGWVSRAAVGSVVGRWGEVVGPEVAAHAVPESFEDGELRLRADSTAWATQLRLLAPQLQRTLDERVGKGTVRKITVMAPSSPSWRRGRLHVRGRGPRDTYG